MASDDWPEWLPSDWTVQIKKIDERKVKCYLDPKGQKFYTKPQVLGHLKAIDRSAGSEKTHNADGSTGNETPEPLTRLRSTKRTTGSSSRKSKESDSIGDGSSSGPEASQGKDGWLPDGWTAEVKTRSSGSHIGMKYKCYTDPISGRKFMSKPQVLNYLANTNNSAAKQEGDKSSTERDKSRKYASNAKKNNTIKATESSRKFMDSEVISRIPADGLPPGWIKETRLRKNAPKKKIDPYYLDPLSGYAFLSKLDALRYLDTGDIKNCAMRPLRKDMNEEDYHNADLTGEELASPTDPSKGNETSQVLNGCVVESKTNERGTRYKKKVDHLTGDGSSTPDVAGKDEVSEWLPDGWIMEMKVRDSGMKYKCFMETASGRKFYSKPQVLNYLAGANSNSISRKRKGDQSSVEPDSSQNSEPTGVRQKRSIKKKKDVSLSAYNEVITTSPADGLPPGWIKEIRTRVYATHKRNDPYYTDPLTGYIFRSKLDALRYLETGDINLCAIKPKKRDADGNEIPVTADEQTPGSATARKQLFEDKEAENFMGNEQNDISTDAAVPTTEENHSQVDFTDPKTADNTFVSTPASRRVLKIVQDRITKRGKSSATVPARTSTRLKGKNLEPKNDTLSNEDTIQAAPSEPPADDSRAVQETQVLEKQVSGVDMEKQVADVDQLSYQLDDPSWTDQCLDFAVKTLTGEIPYNVRPTSASFQEESVGTETVVNEAPTKVN